jgi:hypothetical protein
MAMMLSPISQPMVRHSNFTTASAPAKIPTIIVMVINIATKAAKNIQGFIATPRFINSFELQLNYATPNIKVKKFSKKTTFALPANSTSKQEYQS